MKAFFQDSDSSDEDDGMPSYNDTEEILKKWEAIRQKYAPETDSYAKVNMFGALKNAIKDEYEHQERIEEKKKYNFYNKRSKLAIPDVISMA